MDTIDETGQESDEDENNQEKLEKSFSVECVGFSTHENSQKWIASGGMDSTLKIWDLTNGTLRGTCKHTSTVTDLKWHKSLPVIFASTLDGSICIYRRNSKSNIGHLYA